MDDLESLLNSCAWPSEAFWRSFELQALRESAFERPILELGCGDGSFTALLLDHVDEALDLNPRAVAKASARAGLYGEVRCLDATKMAEIREGQFATVFANCVLEHIDGLPEVLESCQRLLRPGGRLITTVPLVEMNDHLLLSSPAYAAFRQRQLVHVNLWDLEGWKVALHQAGFDDIDSRPYLNGANCRLWDAIDLPGILGHGRYRVATATNWIVDRMIPRDASAKARSWLARRLRRAGTARLSRSDAICAVVIEARKALAAPGRPTVRVMSEVPE